MASTERRDSLRTVWKGLSTVAQEEGSKWTESIAGHVVGRVVEKKGVETRQGRWTENCERDWNPEIRCEFSRLDITQSDTG